MCQTCVGLVIEPVKVRLTARPQIGRARDGYSLRVFEFSTILLNESRIDVPVRSLIELPRNILILF